MMKKKKENYLSAMRAVCVCVCVTSENPCYFLEKKIYINSYIKLGSVYI